VQKETRCRASSSIDIFLDDLLREVEAASQGVPMRPEGAPSQTQGQQAAGTAASGRPPADDAAPAATLKALMFADDLLHWSGGNGGGIAVHHQHLLCVVHQMEDRWRPTSGPLKVQWWSLRPSCSADRPRRPAMGGDTTPHNGCLQVLGDKLHEDCTWHAHIRHAAAK
jgi:hypothetical protein